MRWRWDDAGRGEGDGIDRYEGQEGMQVTLGMRRVKVREDSERGKNCNVKNETKRREKGQLEMKMTLDETERS